MKQAIANLERLTKNRLVYITYPLYKMLRLIGKLPIQKTFVVAIVPGLTRLNSSTINRTGGVHQSV